MGRARFLVVNARRRRPDRSDGETRDETADQSSEPPENGSQQRQGTRTEEGRHAVPSPAGKVPRPQARRRPSNACREEGPAGSPGPPDRDAFSLSLSLLVGGTPRHATRTRRQPARLGAWDRPGERARRGALPAQNGGGTPLDAAACMLTWATRTMRVSGRRPLPGSRSRAVPSRPGVAGCLERADAGVWNSGIDVILVI